MNYTTLKTEIVTDPAHLGYAPLVAQGNDQGVANLLNLPASGQVTMPNMNRDSFMLSLAPVFMVMPSMSATIQGKWDRILNVICSADSVDFTNPNVQSLIGDAVTDGLLTQIQASGINQRTGTRAELLFGAGTTILQSDISMALRNT